MQAFFSQTSQRPDALAAPLLALAVRRSRSDAAYLLRVPHESAHMEVVACHGVPHVAQPYAVGGINGLPDLCGTSAIGPNAWSYEWLSWLPSFVEGRFEVALSIPVPGAGGLQGLLLLARSAQVFYTASDKFALTEFWPAFAILLAGIAAGEESERLKTEIRRLTEKLAGRNVVERAKGVIQHRYSCSEDEAYKHLRRVSRTTRRPMHEIAREFVDKQYVQTFPSAASSDAA